MIPLKMRIQRFFLGFKWKAQKENRIYKMEPHTIREIVAKRGELYEAYLVADKQDNKTEAVQLQAQIRFADWVLRIATLILLVFLITPPGYAASTKIEDKTKSGYKVEVEKIGSDYAISTLVHSKKYMICNKDDDATPYYYGFEAADGSWMILKWTVSAGADVFAYDSGTSAYATAWTGRAALTYASYGTEF